MIFIALTSNNSIICVRTAQGNICNYKRSPFSCLLTNSCNYHPSFFAISYLQYLQMYQIKHKLHWPGLKLFPNKLPTLVPDGNMRSLLAYRHKMTPAAQHPVLLKALNSKTLSHFFSNCLHKVAALSDTFGR